MKKNIVIFKERMKGECRVALTPDHCLQLQILGHKVYVETGAGVKSGYSDEDYRLHKAEVVGIEMLIRILRSPDTVALKVKQPLPEDDLWFRCVENGVLLAYFHSTGDKDRGTIDTLLQNKVTAISYENIQASDGTYPILVPMSEIAGRLAVEWGRKYSSSARKKVGLPEMPNYCICMMVVGAGTVGIAAIKEALKLGFSSVTIFDKDPTKEKVLRAHFTQEEMGYIKFYTPEDSDYGGRFKRELSITHLLIGAALVPGGHAPMVVPKEHVKLMSKGSVIVDVAIDQGGCIWSPENELRSEFWYQEKMLQYCRVPNMPGHVPEESTLALSKAIFPYLLGVLGGNMNSLQEGILTYNGEIINEKARKYWEKQEVAL
jgi:alanine dehydrogenase